MDTTQLIIPQHCYKQIIEVTKSELPYESCGFLSGQSNKTIEVWPLINELKSPNRFRVNQDIVSKTLDEIKSRNQALIATYHTHPTSEPTPSFIDVKMHLSEEVRMLIISYKYSKPHVKCFIIENNKYKECPIHIEML